jgi:hypothetical protein
MGRVAERDDGAALPLSVLTGKFTLPRHSIGMPIHQAMTKVSEKPWVTMMWQSAGSVRISSMAR